MSEVVLKKLQAERTQLRRVFTLAYNELDKVLNDESSILAVEERFLKLADKAERLIQVDQKVSALIFEVVTDEKELEKEFDVIEFYRDQWNEISFKKDSFINRRNQNNSSDDHLSIVKSTVSSNKLKFKMPTLEFKKFDGNIKNWIGFWAQFRKIHEDTSVDLDDKFQILLHATLENSPARELIESFPPSGANYDIAIEQLKNRFGRDELLIQLYIRELLKLVLTQSNKGKTLELRVLYDRLSTQLRALETLGVTCDKYAVMLYPLVESALPEHILKIWERHRSNRSENPINDSNALTELLEFLRREVEGEERFSLARQTFSPTNDDKSKFIDSKKRFNSNNKVKAPTVAGLVSTRKFSKQSLVCVFCQGQHTNENCFKAQEMTSIEIEKILLNKDCCLNCLRKGHSKKQCKASLKCIICSSRHVPLVCPERKILKTKNNENTSDVVEQTLSNINSAHISHAGQVLTNASFPKVIMQTLLVNVIGNGEQKARALIDTGSQRSYITKKLASIMGYNPIKNERVVHALFGGITSEPKKHNCYKVHLLSLDKKYSCNFEAMDTEVICQTVPVAAKGSWCKELTSKGIYLTDINEGPIDILIGSDIAGKIMTGGREELSSGLVAFETTLGWTVMGKVSVSEEIDQVSKDSINTCMSLFCNNQSVSELWRLDILGIEEPSQIKNREEKEALAKRHFADTSKILPDGRYEVRLPWLPDHPILPRNFHLAQRRMERTVEKLKNTNKLNDYRDVFLEWLENEFIEVVFSDDWDVGHYFPHRPVFKEDSTTKIRPVFDASASLKGLPSLNQCLEKGRNLIELIPSILIRFRMEKIGVVSDIKKAFLQISVHPQDRDVLRFLFINDAGELIIYRHKRVVFGVSSSPFLLGSVIEHHLTRYEDLISNEAVTYSADVVTKLKKSFYVDNCVASVSDERELHQFVSQSTAIFKEACFELRGWEWTDSSLNETKYTAVLGLVWDRKRDKLKLNPKSFCCNESNIITKVTRRVILSATQKIFDPIGLCTPTTLLPKLFVQKTWISGQNWDDIVDEDIKNKFLQWLEEIHWLKNVEIDRWFIGFTKNNQQLSLHTFCDASQVAYAAVVFLRIEEDEDVYIHIVEAKSRVTPVKKVSIPRLELIAATIGARMGHRISKEFEDIPTYYWSDSSATIAWIKRETQWGVFVWNRVSEIRRLTDANFWFHVPGQQNPADLLSRGCSPKALALSRWWEGPEWLKAPKCEWPICDVIPDEEVVMAEKKKGIAPSVNIQDSLEIASGVGIPQKIDTSIFSKYFSRYSRIVRLVGWILRFIRNSKKKRKFSGNIALQVREELSTEELNNAEKRLLRMVQEEAFNGINDKLICKLKPQQDSDKLFRICTRIWARKDSEDFRAPIILPPNNVIVERLIYEFHLKKGHIVAQNLLNSLREKYWVIRGKQTVRRVVKKCIQCQRYTAKKMEVETPSLPEDRVRDARIFEIVGIDLAGPLYLRNGTKVWITLFTCAVYRAVHLDIVSSLSTEEFLMALRRFIARRGRPKVIYTDNGSNFKGASNMLNNVDWKKVTTNDSVEPIDWRFNPPSAPWWGGFFERMIGLLKTLLKKNLGKASLTHEELYTTVCECESIINSRPITYVSDCPEELQAITPQMFLKEITEEGVPDVDQLDAASLNRRLRYRRRLKEELRARFRSEYLGQLFLFAKECKNTRQPVVGEIVLISSDNKKRIDWPLAMIEELIIGKDGKCRVVQLRTAEGRVIRPIQRLYPLEVFHVFENSNQAEDLHTPDVIEEANSPETTTTKSVEYCEAETRCGRTVRLPVRYRQ